MHVFFLLKILLNFSIQRKDKAEEMLREELKKEETPYLLCLLGEINNDIESLLKAWELSEFKYFKAQKLLGNYYFSRKEYMKCSEHYKKALELNSMQVDAWSRLGFAAMMIDDYELCASCYRRVVQFDSSFEAWNNLSKAYIKLGQKQRAWYTLQEALKCNFDEWRIWENYIAVCIDIGAFSDVIQCWHRLIDLKGKYDDDQILGIF